MTKRNYIKPELSILNIDLSESVLVNVSGAGDLGNFEDGGVLDSPAKNDHLDDIWDSTTNN